MSKTLIAELIDNDIVRAVSFVEVMSEVSRVLSNTPVHAIVADFVNDADEEANKIALDHIGIFQSKQRTRKEIAR